MTAAVSRTARASSRAAVTAFGVIVLAAIALGLLSAGGNDSPRAVAGAVPAGFPVPADAQLQSAGDVVAFSVPGRLAEVEAFFGNRLPPAGWAVQDTWEGTDPHGLATKGFMLEHEGETGAISFTPQQDGRVLVHLNMSQPTYRDTQSGMGQGP